MVEYALILVLVAIVVLIVLISTGQAFKNLYSDVTTQLNIQAGL
jgi:Flp pilus assembly pilin Flp